MLSVDPQPGISKASRQNSRRKNPKDDDAAYIGASGTKRSRESVEASNDGRRVKRKKVQQGPSGPAQSTSSRLSAVASGARNPDVESAPTMVDFSTFSRETLHRYLVHYDLVPMVYPSPLTASDPPPPYSLLEPVRLPTPPPPTLVPVNRPRRDSDIRKRSSRLVDDENGIFGRTAILADIGDIDHMLAKIAERHFRDEVIREVDTLASFMCTLKTNARIP